MKRKFPPGDLRQIPGVGPSIEQDLREIGIRCVADLKRRDPEELFLQSCASQGVPLDRCLLYVYRLSVYYAEHEGRDPALLKWWHWKDRPYPR